MYGGSPLMPSLVLGRGLCSDDTEHTQMVGRAIVLSGGNVAEFERHFSRQLKCWFLTLPAGVGWATLRACLKLLLGFGPMRSGVHSAGNGPAMRSALLGVWAKSEVQLRQLVRVCTRITHIDPKSEEGALVVARAASLTVLEAGLSPIAFLEDAVREVSGDELRDHLQAAITALAHGNSPAAFAASRGWAHGITGYVNHTVPAALYCWAYSPGDFRKCVENAVLLGGDSDSVAAIAGAICGANLGSDNLPQDWLDCLAEWPRTANWMKRLASSLAQVSLNGKKSTPPRMHWVATVLRNLAFAAVILVIGFRRLLPPY
jgi:ADP-ribosylglycohydrolase